MKANYSGASYDAFSVLASTPSSSKPNSAEAGRAAAVTQGSADAFSSLLVNSGSMSLADRQAAALREQQAKALNARIAKENESAVWSGLDIIGQGSSSNSASNTRSLSDTTLKPTAPPSTHAEDDWGLSDFGSQPQTSGRAQERSGSRDSISLLDALDDSTQDRDLLFDAFGERKEDPLTSNNFENTEDDILGMLAKPVESMPKRPTPPQPAPSASSQARTSTRARASSPPPHLLGQIVEMGFSPQQARLALAATDSGLDVQQALEMLLSNGAGVDVRPDSPPGGSRSRGLAEFQDDEEEGESRRTEVPRPQRAQRQPSSSHVPSSRTETQPPSLTPGDIQERADKLLAQASEIGFTVFNRANAFWKDGKEKVQKVYEERAAKTKPADGRPRWMSEPTDQNAAADGVSVQSGFRDDEDGASQVSRRQQHTETKANGSASVRRATEAQAVKTANLFDDEPAVYVSSRRRAAPSRSAFHAGASSIPASTPVPQKRQAVSASPSAIAASNSHKVKGTEMFKLGQYADAERAYSTAVTGLPANHLLLIPLYNNRALTRIKTGDHSGAVDDCTIVLSIIGTNYHPAREAKVTREDEGSSVDLADALLKAYRRRAEAYEGREKWNLAQRDWEAIVSCEWSMKMRSDALSGSSRCKKMISAEQNPPPRKPPVAPRPVARTVTSTQDFEAVQKLRLANQALEEEEQAKAGLKDAIDAKLIAWKGGKETNVRALVASLDTVLWPGLGWQKVGMHELVTPSQVKIRYMKAIAKVHPDKLNANNTTVEQRMIANGVFATLNEAWIAFKQ
ncbi:hypothetical protein DFH11DRAFT_1689547 [Phellopilus nigrolimitatus]|nr:hypothetical protein DFH11DRAFT_1689547 [Phellopilus nigrolimitatus]